MLGVAETVIFHRWFLWCKLMRGRLVHQINLKKRNKQIVVVKQVSNIQTANTDEMMPKGLHLDVINVQVVRP